MSNTKKKNRPARVHPFFLEVAGKYRKNVEEQIGIPISTPQASKHMAQAFEELVRVNGMPIFNKKKGKKKTIECNWTFDL